MDEDMEEISIRSPSPPRHMMRAFTSESTETLAYASSLVESTDETLPSLARTSSDCSLRRSSYISEDRATPAQRRASVLLLLASIHEPPPSSDRDATTDTSAPRCHGWRQWSRLSLSSLQNMSLDELSTVVRRLSEETDLVNRRLLRSLRGRTNLLAKVNGRCAIVSAVLQAASAKRSEDSTLQFSLSCSGDKEQWLRAMQAATRIAPGLPDPIRATMWVTLADQSLSEEQSKELENATSERLLDGDDEIHFQILKDLHRTGFEGFLHVKKLKQLLLAYARYNKEVGYCQGFNVIGALLLEVVNFDVLKALKVLVFFVDFVLPPGYFDQSLRALSVDMAVVKDLLHQRLPEVSKHLEHLQNCSISEYEPPLTNVFSMHWLLTLFATCLPRELVYRVWDAVMLHGSEVLLRIAVAIWAKCATKVLRARDVDEFYVLTESLTKELTKMGTEEQDSMIKYIYNMAEFPYPGLSDLRDHHTWNIRPITSLRNLDELLDEAPSSAQCRSEIGQLERRYKQLIQRQRQSAVVLNCNTRLGLRKNLTFNHLSISHGTPVLMSAVDMTLDPTTVQPERSRPLQQMDKNRSIQLGFLYGLPCKEDFELLWKTTTPQRSKHILSNIQEEKNPERPPMPPRKQAYIH